MEDRFWACLSETDVEIIDIRTAKENLHQLISTFCLLLMQQIWRPSVFGESDSTFVMQQTLPAVRVEWILLFVSTLQMTQTCKVAADPTWITEVMLL